MEIVDSLRIRDVRHLTLDRHQDGRGWFMETFRATWTPGHDFIQGNLSHSTVGVLRGLHYHLGQEDLWTVVDGRAFAALVDLREGSPSYLAVEAFPLEGSHGVLIPIGVAHGFYAETDLTLSYLVSGYYDGSDEKGVVWDDPEIGVRWPDPAPILSDRDRANPSWADVPPVDRPVWAA